MSQNSPFTQIKSVEIDSAVTNIPTAYSNTQGSKIFSELGYPKRYESLYVYNSTNIPIILTFATNDVGVPHPNEQEICIAPSSAITFPKVPMLDNLFIRSASSTINAGKVYATVFGS